jgi:nucleotide-binding universal stress UspA family protein
MAKIVAGVDGSDEGREALRWAVDEARLRHASVFAVHAWQVPVMPVDVAPVPAPALEVTTLLPEIETGARRLVEQEVAEVSHEGVDVEAVTVDGPAATALIEAARGADLLVVGSRGRGGFTGLLLGSVSAQVAQHAPCPVVICRRSADA